MARLTLNFLFLCGRVGVTGAATPLWRRAFSAACPVSPLAQEDVAHGQSSSLSRVLVLEQASCLMPDGSIKYLFRRMLIALKCSTRSTKPSVGGSQARGEAATCGHMQGGAAGRGGRRTGPPPHRAGGAAFSWDARSREGVNNFLVAAFDRRPRSRGHTRCGSCAPRWAPCGSSSRTSTRWRSTTCTPRSRSCSWSRWLVSARAAGASSRWHLPPSRGAAWKGPLRTVRPPARCRRVLRCETFRGACWKWWLGAHGGSGSLSDRFPAVASFHV